MPSPTATKCPAEADLVRDVFSDRYGQGMAAISKDQRTSRTATDRRYTRIRALIEEILGS